MKIAFASNTNNIKTIIDPLFGRCNWFCIYDTDLQSYSFTKNLVNNNQNNAGTDAAGILISEGVNIAVSGRFGSKASDILRKNNIQMVIPQNQITIEDFINQIQYKK
jgi:predicted Fe-Mo cluster-binding NifX family protein